MILFNVNYLAVLVASLASFFVGFLWYSKTLFGNVWMKASGIKMTNEKPKGMFGLMIGGLIIVLVMAFVLSNLIYYVGASNAWEGMQLAGMIWLGFLATTMLNPVLWEKKPFKLWLINAGHYLVVLLIMGAILGSWN